ncbi:hypothetical protein Y025_5298 [Burkholderia pseudomallei TSV32]|nr:hypothetical protein Y025_5298 [Burkholderia pseudomallei TSV32]
MNKRDRLLRGAVKVCVGTAGKRFIAENRGALENDCVT